MRTAVLTFGAILLWMAGLTQNYYGIEGSPYAGSLGVAVNPASILNNPYPWDLTVFSVQEKSATNAVKFHNISYLSHPDTLNYSWNNGYIKRYATFNYNTHLLNLRLALGKKQAVAFGVNLRGYAIAKTGNFNYNDTLKNMNEFFSINPRTTSYNGNLVQSSWLELFGTYSRTLVDNDRLRLNGGATLKVSRGLAGTFAQMQNGDVNRSITGDLTYYLLNAGSARYGYSANLDRWHDSLSTMTNLKNIFGRTLNGFAMDLGAEVLIKEQAVLTWSEDDYFDYDWKIGFSILDIGWNNYRYGTQSRAASHPRSDISDSLLNLKFDNVSSLANFNDSLATIVNQISTLSGKFKVWNPTRVVLNIDRPLSHDFYINANISFNLSGSNNGKNTFFAKEMNFLGLTPRWEKSNIGAYLPIEYSNNGRLMVGGAFKIGPLLLGLHNWANVFTKNSMQNGGFYLAMVLRPGLGFKAREDRKYECPHRETFK